MLFSLGLLLSLFFLYVLIYAHRHVCLIICNYFYYDVCTYTPSPSNLFLIHEGELYFSDAREPTRRFREASDDLVDITGSVGRGFC
jgi:hypothetical protein